MGFFGSSEESVEQKTIDTNGNVNNNIIIQEARDTHHQMILNEKLLAATYFLCALEVIKFVVYLFLGYRRNIKKRYQSKVNQTSNS